MEGKIPFEVREFLASRKPILDIGNIGLRKHHIKVLVELDVTLGRELIKERRNQNKDEVSFTSWIIKCIGQAVSEYKALHAIRKGGNKLIIFDDLDISMRVEKEIRGEKVPLPLVIRKVNEKTVKDIYIEIKQAKEAEIKSEEDYLLGDSQSKWVMKLFFKLPQFIRLMFWKQIVLKNPLFVKEMSGTALFTSVGMMGNFRGWFIPVSILPLCFALGSIVRKPGIVNDKIEIREYLYMTILFDHDVIDGAPAARFVSRLTELVESGYGI